MKIHTPYIQLNALLKLLGWVETGADANNAIDSGMVMVNGQTELRRRNKIYPGMLVKFGKQQTTIEAADTE
jgi:ribosome-associated protein